eukprot:5675519-Alexandrium_andersonii.AAC.1
MPLWRTQVYQPRNTARRSLEQFGALSRKPQQHSEHIPEPPKAFGARFCAHRRVLPHPRTPRMAPSARNAGGATGG